MASVGDVVEIHDERTEEIAQIFATRALAQPAASQLEKTVEAAQAEQLSRDGE